jgi:hypothetical protein
MSTTKIILIAAGSAAITFALLLFAIHSQLASGLPSGFGRILFLPLLPAYVLGEVLESRPAFLITGFLEFFSIYLLGLLGWSRIHARKRV